MTKHKTETRWRTDAAFAPKAPGAYALLIALGATITLPHRFDQKLPRGRYVYLGSAMAGGGIQARVARHLLKTKTKHWHVDWLTTAASSVRYLGFPGGSECLLTTALLTAGFDVPIKGLGSSDCQSCPSHLLRVPTAIKRGDLATLLVTTR